MARQASSYRQARRAAWKELNATNPNGPTPWASFNTKAGYGIGTKPATRGEWLVRNRYGALVNRVPRQPEQGRSKYMPHIGKKQHAKATA
jgi:hypothetical protein